MAGIKLERLPDRTPVKITILVLPELNRALGDYAEAYGAAWPRRASRGAHPGDARGIFGE